MKKHLFVCAVLSSMLSSTVMAAPINVGVVEYPPHINVKGKAVSGKAIEYVTNVLKSVGLEPKFTPYTAQRGMAEFQAGRIDLLMPIGEDIKDVKKLSKPLFHATPGLCFRKDNFISILSATHRFKGLKVGYTDGAVVVGDLADGGAKMVPIKGKATMKRGIDMLIVNRFDAIYHPDPVKVYNMDSPHYKKIACSYFYGHSKNVFISASPKLDGGKFDSINSAFTKALEEKSYEFFFAEGG
ncbi:MAG: hypothetical protein ACI8WB_000182 [Phenylobacterium sp.]|jgi:hypothetical protein